MTQGFMRYKMKNALSVDVEDWYQGILQIGYNQWSQYEERLSKGLNKVLDLFAKYNARATFFVLGYIADKFPEAVERIARGGHEVASHGYYHRPIFEQTPQEFEEDVSRSKKIIESITNTKVKGYRAPFFSVRKDTLWALDILEELGFEYDSSIFPTKNFLYGIPDSAHTAYKAGKGKLVEFPLSVIGRGRFTIPVCGGFYMRVMPYKLIKHGIRHFNRSKGPAVIYMHPWELDKEKPKLPMPLKWRIIYDYNIKTMGSKIERLINDFSFTTIGEVLFGG